MRSKSLLKREVLDFQTIPTKPQGDAGLDGFSHGGKRGYCCYGPENRNPEPSCFGRAPTAQAIDVRVARQQANQRSFALREAAHALADRINNALLRRGWRINWSGNGTVGEILARWSSRPLRDRLNEEANIDQAARREQLNARIAALRDQLTSRPIDPNNVSVPAEASQKVIQLKQVRHQQNSELNTLRTQYAQTEELIGSLEHRIHAASDLLRLKTTGIGRLDHLECPTCHRDLGAPARHFNQLNSSTY